MKKLIILCFSLFSVLLIVQGCSVLGLDDKSNKTRMYNSAAQLVEKGAVAFEKKRYRTALKAYSQLKDWYPFSRYAILAELRIADSHFELEEYDEAIFAYTDFEELHPRNDAIDRVIYRRGLCWYKRVDSVDRDTKSATEALVQFRRLKERFPDSPFVGKIDKKMARCIDNLAGHELYVAEFYYKSNQYRASLNRYKHIVEYFPTSKHASLALNRISQLQKKVDKLDKKPPRL